MPIDKGMGVSVYSLEHGGKAGVPRKFAPILRFGNRSEPLERCGVVQPLKVYRMGYLLATACAATSHVENSANFAC
jgi:hypothetical protein